MGYKSSMPEKLEIQIEVGAEKLRETDEEEEEEEGGRESGMLELRVVQDVKQFMSDSWRNP